MQKKIIVVGAGAWGTAVANLISINNITTCLIANNKKIVDEINLNNSNSKFLPNITLNKNLKSSINLEQEALLADIIFIATPSIATKKLLLDLSKLKLKESCGFVICSKGLEQDNLKFFHQIIEEIFPNKKYAILSGPNFAIEVAEKLATITTIATKNLDFAQEVTKILNNNFFHAKICEDFIAAEISAIVKNIIAIACGISDGLNLGQNTKAAIMCKGIEEIEILCNNFHSPAKISNAAGFGDIFLTCATTKSRNNSLGFSIGKGEKPSELLNQGKTFEGAINAKSINKLAAKLALKLKLCETVASILENEFLVAEIKEKIIAAIIN